MKTLFNYSFLLVENITLEKNKDGSIKEFIPKSSSSKEKPFHNHGKGPFCYFSIPSEWKEKTGVYIFYAEDQILYIGKCEDLFRIMNQGIGKIFSSDRYRGGQPTNCKVNNAILNNIKEERKVTLYFHETQQIDIVKKELVDSFNPPYNG